MSAVRAMVMTPDELTVYRMVTEAAVEALRARASTLERGVAATSCFRICKPGCSDVVVTLSCVDGFSINDPRYKMP